MRSKHTRRLNGSANRSHRRRLRRRSPASFFRRGNEFAPPHQGTQETASVYGAAAEGARPNGRRLRANAHAVSCSASAEFSCTRAAQAVPRRRLLRLVCDPISAETPSSPPVQIPMRLVPAWWSAKFLKILEGSKRSSGRFSCVRAILCTRSRWPKLGNPLNAGKDGNVCLESGIQDSPAPETFVQFADSASGIFQLHERPGMSSASHSFEDVSITS